MIDINVHSIVGPFPKNKNKCHKAVLLFLHSLLALFFLLVVTRSGNTVPRGGLGIFISRSNHPRPSYYRRIVIKGLSGTRQ